MRAKSRKVLLPPLVDKIGFIGNLTSFMIITPQVKAQITVRGVREMSPAGKLLAGPP
jgi:hypothetical protein